MDKFIKKIGSRKLWMALAGFTTGIAIMLGADGQMIADIAGGVLAVLSCINYVRVEGKVDAEAAKNAVIGVQTVVDTIEGVDVNESQN